MERCAQMSPLSPITAPEDERRQAAAGQESPRGPRLPLEQIVKRQTSDTADYFGLNDRGRLAPGMRADINVIDFDMAPREDGAPGPEIARVLIKALNLTPYNYLKHGMNLNSLESIFARDDEDFSPSL